LAAAAETAVGQEKPASDANLNPYVEIRADGKVVLFEANATMSFFPFAPDPQFEYLRLVIEPAQRAFRELLGLPPFQPGQVRFRLESG